VLTVVGAALYGLPLVVWLRYSEEIVSAGGLAAFVEAAVGHRLALVQAGIWVFSYFLYLPYTVADILYELLGDVFPGLEPWRPYLEVALPIAIVGFVLLSLRTVLSVLLVSAALQLLLMLGLGFVMIREVGAPLSSFTTVPGGGGLARGSANIALLFLCGSLPLFLGTEVVGRGRVVRRALPIAGAIVAAYLVFAAFPLAAVDPKLVSDDLPGYAIASAYSSRAFAVAIGLGAAVSVAGLIVIEYLALSRLLHAFTRVPVRKLLIWIGVPFVAVDALSLTSPHEFDENVLRPSLIALFISQMIVFAVFPTFRARRGKLTALDVAIAAGAFALMAWGLYRAVFHPVST
jgi:hypothetical protein